MAMNFKRLTLGHAPFLVAFGIMLGAFDCGAAEQYTAVPIPLENSRVGFIGDDAFITARLAYTPRHPSYLWRERLTFAGGVILLAELMPGRIFTQEGKWAESQAMIAEWKGEQYLTGKGLSITTDDVRQGSNRYGTYYYAIKENQNGKCGSVKQVFGYQSNDAGPQGNKRFNLLSCWVPANGAKENYEAFLLDIMTRIRADEGEINKAKAAAPRNPLPSVPPAASSAAPTQPVSQPAPPSQTQAGSNSSIEMRLRELESIFQKKLVTKDEYDKKRKEILSGL
jgi:hypothetical protein